MPDQQRATILSNTRSYFLSEFVSNTFYLLSITFLTRLLGSQEWGYYSTVVILFKLLTQLTTTTFSQGLFRLYFKKEDADRKQMITSIAAMSFISMAILSIVSAIFGDRIIKYLFNNIETTSKLTLLLISGWIFCLGGRLIATSLAKAKEKPLHILRTNGIYHGTHLALILICYAFNIPTSIELAFSFLLIAEVASGISYISIISFPTRIKIQHCKECLVVALPLTGTTLLFTIFLQTDKIVISRFINLTEMGSYNLGIMIGGIVGTIATTMLAPINARVLNILKSHPPIKAQKVSKQANSDILILVTIAACSAISLSNYILPIIGGDTLSIGIATMALTGRVLGQVLRTVQQLFQNCLYYAEKYRIIFGLNLILPLAGATSAYLLTTKAGTNATSFYYPISYGILCFVTFPIAKRYYLITFPRLKSALCAISIFAASSLETRSTYFNFKNFWTIDAIQFALLLILCFIFRETIAAFVGGKNRNQNPTTRRNGLL